MAKLNWTAKNAIYVSEDVNGGMMVGDNAHKKKGRKSLAKKVAVGVIDLVDGIDGGDIAHV
ncbi:hypothetical protein WKH57_28060 [Niallia taxi]|uniref:hypothetical protein n=1 Tax=Niallia taxi TaxID=2499688 RepID=UPI00316C2930